MAGVNELHSLLADGAVAVTPNRRLARRLHADFDAALAASGRRAWRTPTILAYPVWVASLWSALDESPGADPSPALLAPSQSRALWQRVIEESGADLADTRGAAALAQDAWSLLHEWGEGGESWRGWAAGQASGESPDAAMFAAWCDAYLARQRRLEVIDLAQAPDRIVRRSAALEAKPALLLVGFAERTPAQRRLLDALASSGIGIRDVDPLPAHASRAVRTIAATPQDEIAAALGWARGAVVATPGIRVGIVVEDLAQRRDAVLAQAQDMLDPASALPGGTRARSPFDISLGTPLSGVPVVGAALTLIALSVGALPAGAVAALLRTPYIAGADASRHRLARLERRWLEDGVDNVTLADAIAAINRLVPDIAVHWRRSLDTTPPLRAASPRAWADRWRAWLDVAGWPGTRTLDSAEYQARKAWESLLAEFVALGAVTPRQDGASAVATLRAMADETLHQPEGSEAPIQILGAIEGAGLAFDALWVAGLSSDRWPATPRPNPLLPIDWQRERALPRATAQRELEYARGLTERYARAAEDVVFSSASGIDDPPLSPSTLLLAYPEMPLPPKPETWRGAMAGRAALETLPDVSAPPLAPGTGVRGGAHVIQSQSDCPFQATARHRLRVEQWPPAPAGLRFSERGRLVHAMLAAFWSAVGDQARLVALEREGLDTIVAEAIAQGMTELQAARWRQVPAAVRAAESRRLDRLLRAWLTIERDRPPFAVEAIEQVSALALGGIALSVRIDRIDALDGGGVAIIDYKAGRIVKPAQWFDDRPRATQLGLYALTQRARSPEIAVRAAANVQLCADAIAPAGLAADEAAWPGLSPVADSDVAADWRSLEAWWRLRLGALAAEIAAGVATVTPRANPSPCKNCRLHALCRIDSVRPLGPEDDDES